MQQTVILFKKFKIILLNNIYGFTINFKAVHVLKDQLKYKMFF